MRVSEIIRGERAITADTALRLAVVFGTTPQFWLGLQNDHDLAKATKDAAVSSIQNDPLIALYRYFIVASRIGEEFERVQNSQQYKQNIYALSTNDFISYLLSGAPCLYFIWCGLLYTVVEGYQELKLTDLQVDSLLSQSTRLDVLRRCRNGMFHFQADYFDDRFMGPLKDPLFTQWAVDLSKALGVSITNELQTKGPIPPPQLDLSQFL